MTNPTMIQIDKLRPFEGHPYKVLDNEEMNDLIGSIQDNGILSPLIVRPLEGTDEYEVISGHYAAQRAGMNAVPALIYPISRDEAAVLLVDSNLHREYILPSEKAFAYRLKMEALDRRGKRCGQVGHKSRDDVSETESGRTVQRYIRLTYLIPALLDLMDEGRMAFSVGVELSYLDRAAQEYLADLIERDECTPSYSQAVRMHRCCMGLAVISDDQIESIMAEEKPNQREQIKFRRDELDQYFPRYYTDRQIRQDILAGLDLLKRQRERNRDRDAR